MTTLDLNRIEQETGLMLSNPRLAHRGTKANVYHVSASRNSVEIPDLALKVTPFDIHTEAIILPVVHDSLRTFGLEHHVPTYYAHGSHGATENYIITEFIDGDRIPAPVSRAAALNLGLLMGNLLKSLNSFGVCHNDAGLHNLLFTDDPNLVLVDFDIATLGKDYPFDSDRVVSNVYNGNCLTDNSFVVKQFQLRKL